MPNYGTLSISDTLAVQNNQTVAAFGEDRAFQAITDYYAAHDAIMREQLSELVETTTDRLRKSGALATMAMSEVDEFGRVDAQKVTAGENLGFPLRMYATALQWTRKYFQVATTRELAAQIEAARTGDVLNVQRQIKTAFFTPTNYSFVDRLVDEITLPVKALANADGFNIPIGPNGETFDASTHTHYLARAGGSLAASDVSAVISTVAEHYSNGAIMLLINQAQEAAIRAFTSNFTPYVDARIRVGANSTVANGTLDQSNVYNRAIGIFDQAEVWVKPWVPANYMIALIGGQQKVLAWRERTPGSSGFVLDYDNEQWPLRAQQMGREFGIGVQNRVGAAALYVGGTSYVTPTF